MKFILGNIIKDSNLKKLLLQKLYTFINFNDYKFKIINNKELAQSIQH